MDFIETQLSSVSQARLQEDEVELRLTALDRMSRSRAATEYAALWNVGMRLLSRFEAIDSDADLFQGHNGKLDVELLKAWVGLAKEARSILEALTKIKNSDRLTVAVLESHTKMFAQLVAAPLTGMLREIQDEPDTDRGLEKLRELVDNELISIFRTAALESMTRSKDKYSLY